MGRSKELDLKMKFENEVRKVNKLLTEASEQRHASELQCSVSMLCL